MKFQASALIAISLASATIAAPASSTGQNANNGMIDNQAGSQNTASADSPTGGAVSGVSSQVPAAGDSLGNATSSLGLRSLGRRSVEEELVEDVINADPKEDKALKEAKEKAEKATGGKMSKRANNVNSKANNRPKQGGHKKRAIAQYRAAKLKATRPPHGGPPRGPRPPAARPAGPMKRDVAAGQAPNAQQAPNAGQAPEASDLFIKKAIAKHFLGKKLGGGGSSDSSDSSDSSNEDDNSDEDSDETVHRVHKQHKGQRVVEEDYDDGGRRPYYDDDYYYRGGYRGGYDNGGCTCYKKRSVKRFVAASNSTGVMEKRQGVSGLAGSVPVAGQSLGKATGDLGLRSVDTSKPDPSEAGKKAKEAAAKSKQARAIDEKEPKEKAMKGGKEAAKKKSKEARAIDGKDPKETAKKGKEAAKKGKEAAMKKRQSGVSNLAGNVPVAGQSLGKATGSLGLRSVDTGKPDASEAAKKAKEATSKFVAMDAKEPKKAAKEAGKEEAKKGKEAGKAAAKKGKEASKEASKGAKNMRRATNSTASVSMERRFVNLDQAPPPGADVAKEAASKAGASGQADAVASQAKGVANKVGARAINNIEAQEHVQAWANEQGQAGGPVNGIVGTLPGLGGTLTTTTGTLGLSGL